MGPEGDLVSARLVRGCRCFGAWSGDVLAGYGWLSSGPEWIGELDLEIRPGAGEAYVWNCATLPDHRRKGVFRDIVAGLTALARAERLSRLWIGTVAVPAEKAVPQAGFAPVLHFSTEVLSGVRWLKVVAEEMVEPGLLAAGREVLAVGGRPLRLDTFMKRAEPRRH
jgi:GNAT superfamily N-acetyltransferase